MAEAAKNESGEHVAVTVEPCAIVLSEREADLLADIVARRVDHGMGPVDEVRKYTVREFVVAGLLAIARAEGVVCEL